MINIYVMIAILIANIAAIGIVYNFIKKLPKKEILVFIAISVALMYVLIYIVYWLTGFTVDKTVHESSKNLIIFLFVPINVIIFIPYIAAKYNKVRQNKIKKEELTKKITKMGILLIIVLIIEYFYIGNIQKNISKIGQDIKENEESNILNNEISVNTKEDTQILTNEIVNKNIVNINNI